MTFMPYPGGGYVVLDGSREVAWVRHRDHARAVAALLSRPSPGPFDRAEEDRLDWSENHVTYPKKGRKQ